MASKTNAGRIRPNARFEPRLMHNHSFTSFTARSLARWRLRPSGGSPVLPRVVLLFCFAASAVTATADLFVSPTGSDANPGSRAKPFATLERARDAVRELQRAGKLHKAGLTVWLRGGDFLRTNALELTAADSGTPNGPVVWSAYGNERVRLLGARALKGF